MRSCFLSIVLLMSVVGVFGQKTVDTGLVTLHARDPLANSLCFEDNGFGTMIQDNQLKNRCSDLNFHSYSPNSLSTGIEGGKTGAIINLGTPDDLRKKYGYTETVGNGQGFASIAVRNGSVTILREYKKQTFQDLVEAKSLLEKTTSVASAPVALGNIYVLRIADTHDASYEKFVKLLVVGYVPNESVTIRWMAMPKTSLQLTAVKY